MACRLIGAKLLSEPMLKYWQLVQISVKSYAKFAHFIQENAFENVICETAAILSRPQCGQVPVCRRNSNLVISYKGNSVTNQTQLQITNDVSNFPDLSVGVIGIVTKICRWYTWLHILVMTKIHLAPDHKWVYANFIK